MSAPYLITFKPINRFFFGSSRAFAEGFYVESMKYPQPTTMLGFFRYTILKQNGIDPRANNGIPDLSDNEFKHLTGTSIMKGLDDNDDNFGKIEKLSPVFIVKEGDTGIEDIVFPVPADIEVSDCKLNLITYEKKSGAISSYLGKRRDYAVLSSRDPKLHSKGYLGGKEFWDAYINNKQPFPYNSEYAEEKVFKAHTSVGIGREGRVAKEGMFYTKIDYSFHKGYSFGILVWLSNGNVLNNGVVTMGGEQSAFWLDIKQLPADDIFSSHPVINAIVNNNCDFFEVLKTIGSNAKLVALSPIVFDKTLNKSLMDVMEHRIVNGVQSMRMLTSGGKGEKSESICMIPTGSVFYPQKSADITLNWKIPKIPFKIGYNYVIKFKE